MRSLAQSSLLVALQAILGVVLVGCGDSDFLAGAKCDEQNKECGRFLECENGVCGGCPEGLLSDEGQCLCPGERIFECRRLVESHCMPVCASRMHQCQVVDVSRGEPEPISACVDPPVGLCFRLEPDQPMCEGDMRISFSDDNDQRTIVVNCPPPESEDSDFDCE